MAQDIRSISKHFPRLRSDKRILSSSEYSWARTAKTADIETVRPCRPLKFCLAILAAVIAPAGSAKPDDIMATKAMAIPNSAPGYNWNGFYAGGHRFQSRQSLLQGACIRQFLSLGLLFFRESGPSNTPRAKSQKQLWASLLRALRRPTRWSSLPVAVNMLGNYCCWF